MRTLRFEGGDERVLLVDIGGARGYEIGAVKERYLHSPARFILEDLPDDIRRARPVPVMETMHYNFFRSQTIQGRPAIELLKKPYTDISNLLRSESLLHA